VQARHDDDEPLEPTCRRFTIDVSQMSEPAAPFIRPAAGGRTSAPQHMREISTFAIETPATSIGLNRNGPVSPGQRHEPSYTCPCAVPRR